MKKFSAFLLSFSGVALKMTIIVVAMVFLVSCGGKDVTKPTPAPPVNPNPPTQPTQTAPGIFSNVKVTPGDKTVSVTGDTTVNGGSKITGYTLSVHKYDLAWSLALQKFTVTAISLAKTVTVASIPAVIDGLVNAATYKVVVKANNAIGSSAPSDSVEFVPILPIIKALCANPIYQKKHIKVINGVTTVISDLGEEMVERIFNPNGTFQTIILPGNPSYTPEDIAAGSLRRSLWFYDDQGLFHWSLSIGTLTMVGEDFEYTISNSDGSQKHVYTYGKK